MRRIVLGLAVFAITAFDSALADDPPKPCVRIDLQAVAISPERAIQLLPKLRRRETFDAAFQELQAMIGKSEAELLGWPVFFAGLDDFESTNSRREISFATEFTTPQIPQIFGNQGVLVPPTDELVPYPLWGPTAPTAFEAHPCGLTVECENTVSADGRQVALKITAVESEFLGNRTMRSGKTPAGFDGLFELPDFATLKVNSTITLHVGRRELLASFVESRPKSRVVVFLIEAQNASSSPGP